MKQQIKYYVFFFWGLLVSLQASSQKETFDIMTYAPPKDWKKDAKTGVVNYTDVNMTTGTFCVITVYASKPGSGDAEKDFKAEWKELVSTPYKAEADPKTEIGTTPAGWKTVVAAASVQQDGTDLYMILAMYSGFGKIVSIRSSLNSQAYASSVDAFLATLELDKTTRQPAEKITAAPATSKSVPGKFGLMTYTSLPDWKEEKFSDGVVFKPLDLPADEQLAVQIMQPLIFSGTLDQAFVMSYDEAAIMYKGSKMYYAGGAEYQASTPQKSFGGWEYIRGSGSIQVENGTPYKTELGLELMVIKINNRFERVAILQSRKNCNYSRYYSYDRLTYKTAIDNFLYNLQFTDNQEPALQSGSWVGSGIIGVWQGISLSAGQVTSTEPLGIRYKVFSPIFLSNGQAYFGSNFPTAGLKGLNTRVPPELNRRDWGTYTFSNGRGILKMAYGDIPLRMEGSYLVITSNKTDHKFFQLPSVDGARFSGTYALNELNGKIPSITFSYDGKFTDNGALRVLYHEYTDCLNPALLPGSGTYEVANYSVVFTYNDGRKIQLAFTGAEYDPKNPSPAVLRMSSNEDPMQRQ